MRASLGIQARIRQPQPLHRPAVHKMFSHNLLHIFHMHKPIPDRIRIDHHDRPMLALVETAQLIGANLPLQSRVLHGVFESRFKLPATLLAATGPRRVLVPLIGTDKNVVLELWQS